MFGKCYSVCGWLFYDMRVTGMSHLPLCYSCSCRGFHFQLCQPPVFNTGLFLSLFFLGISKKEKKEKDTTCSDADGYIK